MIKNFLNPEGHQIPFSYGHFTEGVDLAYWWSCIWKGFPLKKRNFFSTKCFNCCSTFTCYYYIVRHLEGGYWCVSYKVS